MNINITAYELVVITGILAEEMHGTLVVSDHGIYFMPRGLNGGGQPLRFRNIKEVFVWLTRKIAD
jgi:hypothetical protein